MTARVEVVIQPLVLRLSLHEGAPLYHVAADPWLQLDGAEEALGRSPQAGAAFGELAFIPICSTTLIRGKKTILVDPGNMHLGLSGVLRARLRALGLEPGNVDLVVVTHAHHDHLSAISAFRGRPLAIGAADLAYLAEAYWPAYAQAFTSGVASEIREVGSELTLDECVKIISTPGHTPGSITVLVETSAERVAIVGDCAMTQDEYETRRLSHWYTTEQVAALNASLDRVAAWGPTVVIPGHDRAFRPGGRAYDARASQW